MVRGVIEHTVFPAAETEPPQGPAHDALADLPGGYKRVSDRQAPHAVADQSRAIAYVHRHDREGQRHNHRVPDGKALRNYAGICQLYSRNAAAMHTGYRPQGVALFDLVYRIARVPRQQGHVRFPSGYAVGRQAVRALEAPQRGVSRAAEYAVGIKLSEARPVQRELQQLYGGTQTSHTQYSHSFPPPEIFSFHVYAGRRYLFDVKAHKNTVYFLCCLTGRYSV